MSPCKKLKWYYIGKKSLFPPDHGLCHAQQKGTLQKSTFITTPTGNFSNFSDTASLPSDAPMCKLRWTV